MDNLIYNIINEEISKFLREKDEEQERKPIFEALLTFKDWYKDCLKNLSSKVEANKESIQDSAFAVLNNIINFLKELIDALCTCIKKKSLNERYYGGAMDILNPFSIFDEYTNKISKYDMFAGAMRKQAQPSANEMGKKRLLYILNNDYPKLKKEIEQYDSQNDNYLINTFINISNMIETTDNLILYIKKSNGK